MDIITIPEIIHEREILKSSKTFDIQNWNQSDIWWQKNNSWFEAEWFIIGDDWSPLVYGPKGLQEIPSDIVKIDAISRYPNWEDAINECLVQRTNGVFQQKIAKITQELYLPSIEISFDQGYAMDTLIQHILSAFDELGTMLDESNALFLPIWNLPIRTSNIPNLANPYYEYLFNNRDGYDIADFRGAALQLHKWMEDKQLAIYVFNKIRHFLPFFLTISWNSPFHNGKYRGNISERTATKASWKMTGIPDAIDDTFYRQLQDWLNTTIKSVTPYYYAVRYPRVDIRTIENCSMDMVHDITFMLMSMDIYYRITEKLRIHYYSQEPLPDNIFWKDTSCMVETNVIRENYHRVIRNGTKTSFAQVWRIWWDQDFTDMAWDILDWISNIPSTIPPEIKNKFDIPKDSDFSSHVLWQIIKNGNLGERTIDNLWLKRGSLVHPIYIPTSELQTIMLSTAKAFRKQITDLLYT